MSSSGDSRRIPSAPWRAAVRGGLLSGMKTIPILPLNPEVFGTFPGHDRKPHQADRGSEGLLAVARGGRERRRRKSSETAIEGATEASYTPKPGDVGKTLKVRVTFTDGLGTEESVTSEATESVAALVPGAPRGLAVAISAHPVWMQAVLPAAIARFHDSFPGIELKLRAADRPQGIRLLTEGASDLHCGGIDAGEPLPPFLRRDSFVEVEAGIVARKDHPYTRDAPGSKTSPAGRGSTTTVRRRRTGMPVAGRRSSGYCTTSISAPADGRGPSSAPVPPDRFRWRPARISPGCR